MTEHRESDELQIAPTDAEDRNDELEVEQEDETESMLTRWTTWAKMIDR